MMDIDIERLKEIAQAKNIAGDIAIKQAIARTIRCKCSNSLWMMRQRMYLPYRKQRDTLDA